MTVILENHKLFYPAVPKVACSSIKTMFFEIENGFPFQRFTANGEPWHIHRFYPGRLRTDFPESRIEDFRRLAVVRDPIKRLLSAYSNRVVYHQEASADAVRRLGRFKKVTPNPSLDEFVDRFERYREIRAIGWHSRPMVDFIGTDTRYFHAIYGIQQLDAFAEDVSTVVGKKVEIGRHQTGGPKFDLSDLTAKQIAKLENFYKADYKTFSRYF